jgi:hypothetical protein
MKLLTKLKVLVTLTTVTVVAPAMVGHAETATPVTNNANALSIAAEGPLNNPTPDKSLNYYWNLNTNPDISDPTQTWGISQGLRQSRGVVDHLFSDCWARRRAG